jgi:hypothetical protein
MSRPVKNLKKTEETPRATVSTLRGVKRMARTGNVQNWTGPKVRTRTGFKVTARIVNGQVEVMDPTNGNKWTPYPDEGKNLDPSWSPTPPQK